MARQLGFLGPGSIDGHLEHSAAFITVLPEPALQAVDLGSGGGVPGLVLACLWPGSRWLLIESNRRRAEFLDASLAPLDLADRVEVAAERAEVVGRWAGRRQWADLVVARGFGPPAVTAECAAPLLRRDGLLVVAEPPGGHSARWPASSLGVLGMAPAGASSEPVALQRLRQETTCPDQFPRRVGVPSKRPLWVTPRST